MYTIVSMVGGLTLSMYGVLILVGTIREFQI